MRVDRRRRDALLRRSCDDACLTFVVAQALAEVGQADEDRRPVPSFGAARKPPFEHRGREARVRGSLGDVEQRLTEHRNAGAEHVERPPRNDHGALDVEPRQIAERAREGRRKPGRGLRLRQEPAERIAQAARVL